MELTLDEHELKVLRNVLQITIPELRDEIYKTERYELREALKRDEATVKAILERIEALLGTQAAT